MKSTFFFLSRFIIAYSFMFIVQLAALSVFPDSVQLYIPSIAISVMMMLLVFKNDRKLDLGLSQQRSFILHGQGFLLGILLISLSFATIYLFQAVQIMGITWDQATIGSLVSTTVLFLIVAFQEELFFRGYLFALGKRLFQNQVTTLILSSVLFSLTHALNPNVLSNPVPLLNIAIAGLLLGYLRLISGGIWLPIGFHWSWNLFQGSVFGFSVSGITIESIITITPQGNPLLSGGLFGAEGSLLTGLILLICLFILYRISKQKRVSKEEVVD